MKQATQIHRGRRPIAGANGRLRVKTGKSQIENNNTASPSKADVSIAAASQITQTSPYQPR
jgi:hypothetical protein